MKEKGYAKFGGSGVCGRQIRCIVGNVQVAYKAFSHTRPASMQIYWNKRKRLHNKEFNSNMAAVSLFWDTNMAAVKSCESTLFRM